MKNRRKQEVCLLLAVLLSAGTLGAHEGLWEKAVEFYSRVEESFPQDMTMKFLELEYRNEQVKKSQIMQYQIAYTDSGESESTLVYYEKDGVDLTGKEEPSGMFGGFGPPSQEERNSDGEGSGSDPFGFSTSPFDPEQQSRVTYTLLEGGEMVNGVFCRKFSYTFSLDKYTHAGTAWIGEASGVPLLLEYSLDPPMRFTSRLDTRINYRLESPDKWFIHHMTMDVAARFLLIRKKFQVHVILDDYL